MRRGRGLRNPPTWRRLDAAGETTNREKQSTHKFNEVRQRAYVLGARERDFIDSTINTTNKRRELEEFLEIFLRIQYMRALASIYSHRVPGFKETQIEFDSIQKRNLNPKRKVQTRLSVDRPVDRPCHGRPARSTAPNRE